MVSKPNMPTLDLAVGCAVNAFFTGMRKVKYYLVMCRLTTLWHFTVNCLVDLSFSTWALSRADLGALHLVILRMTTNPLT
jgi:hypothetical protein